MKRFTTRITKCCIEKVVTDSRQGVILQLGGWTTGYQFLPHPKRLASYEM